MNGFLGSKPVVTTDPAKLEQQAKSKMTPKAFNFLAGGSGERATVDANRLAFQQWKIVPRMLRGSEPRDLSITLFGKKYPTPIMIAPIGFQNIFHKDAETGVAGVASELGIPYVMSMNSYSTVEEVGTASKNNDRWFQLYWPPSDYMTIQILERAKAAGFNVLVVTLDAFTLGWRPWDLDEGYMPANMPRFPNTTPTKVPNGTVVRDVPPPPAGNGTGDASPFKWDQYFSPPPSWDRLKFLRQHWPGPILLKGIQHPDDAEQALTAGMNGIIVSNHGGRQADGGIGSLDALPEIVEAVGGKMTVLFDSGVRTGADVIKALSLGANGVLIGRPWAYGLGIGGKEGAKAVLRGILAQVEINMSIAGIKSVKECNRSVLRRLGYYGSGGNLSSN
ncbi:oxidoreductase [Tothia fuscella]|uniref:Oxidoreductase n=1 Tax=Tothia fuscella TaxID=1048955 RepID=A0A9P4U2S7_9PEZI|nr:oxidoreductase [Tothia fuscella]